MNFPRLRPRDETAFADENLQPIPYEATVAVLAAALELRDDETGGHAERVTEVAMQLAYATAPDLARNPHLRIGFLLHDLGKIGIPDAILRKPGPLTPSERRQMEQHPILGERLIAKIPYLDRVAVDVVLYHHERWDGSGYPWGLRGEAIPLAARIFSIADAYDAMTSSRPYQEPLGLDVVLDEVRCNAGTQFDPDLVHAFVEIAPRLHAPPSFI